MVSHAWQAPRGRRMTGSVVKCSKRHERSGRCVTTASVPEVLYREGGPEGDGWSDLD